MNTEKNYPSRRTFLTALGMGAGALALGCVPTPRPSSPAAAAPRYAGMAIRKNIADLAVDDPEVRLIKDGLSILKKRSEISPLDPRGWQGHSIMHATFCATSMYSNQVHYCWYVWPWHRAYLWSLEQKLQQAVGEPTLALHYWDWTKNRKIPAHYWGGEDNPLFNITRQVTAEDEIPADFINVGAAFRASEYKTFGGYPAIKEPGEEQRDGIAEQSFHNNIHNWIGGQMATFTESGFDPIFYGHHGNCDRIWAAWRGYTPANTLPEEEEWLDKRIFVSDGNGRPVDFRIRDLLETEALGYRFTDVDLNQKFCNPLMEYDKPPRNRSAQDCVAAVAADRRQSGRIFREFTNKERTHVVVTFDRAQLPYQPYCARIYFEYAAGGEPRSKYVGTFTILPIVDIDTVLLQKGVHLQIEIEREIAEALRDEQAVRVVFQPVPLPNRDIPPGKLELENVSILLDYA